MGAIRGAAIGAGLVIVSLFIAGGAALLGWFAGAVAYKYGPVYGAAIVLILLLLIGGLVGARLFGNI